MKMVVLSYSLLVLMISVIACGGNVFESFVEPATDQARLDEVAKLVDQKNYQKALDLLLEVEVLSNRRQLLEAAAHLGLADVGVWQIIKGIISPTDQDTDSVSFDSIFNSLGDDFFGEGEVRAMKTEAMQSGIIALLASPNSEERRTKSVSCFIGSILSLITSTEGSQAIGQVSQALTTIQSNSTGESSSDAECPGADDLEEGIANLNRVRDSLALIFQATEGCSFIDLGSDSPNQVEEKIGRVIDRADLGCQSTPDCGTSPACEALSLSCVQNRIDVSEGVAGDNELASCELIQNCIDRDCF